MNDEPSNDEQNNEEAKVLTDEELADVNGGIGAAIASLGLAMTG